MDTTARRIGLTSLDEISGPSTIRLDADAGFLKWELRRDGMQDRSKKAVSMQDVTRKLCRRSTKGSLAAFCKLAGVPPEERDKQVLEFVKKWGVLALDPYVREREQPRSAWAGSVWESSVSEAREYNRATESLYYSEPVFTYVDLANIFDSLLKINAKIRAGVWHTIRRADIYQATTKPSSRADLIDNDYPDYLAEAFAALNDMRIKQAKASKMYEQLNLITSYLSPSSYPLRIAHRGDEHEADLCVLFNAWHDGCEWDRRQAVYCQRWEMSGYPFSGVLNIVDDNLAPLSSGTRSRPSALYSALMFQLMLHLLPGESSAFCANCHAEFKRDLTKRKPRHDVDFCPDKYHECKAAYKKKYYKEYDKTRSPRSKPEKQKGDQVFT